MVETTVAVASHVMCAVANANLGISYQLQWCVVNVTKANVSHRKNAGLANRPISQQRLNFPAPRDIFSSSSLRGEVD